MNDGEIQMVRSALGEVIRHYDGDRERLGTAMAFYSLLANELSRAVGKEPSWTWRYVQGVAARTIKPSPLFGSAVYALGAALDDVPAPLAYVQQIGVLARPGEVLEGSLILGTSKKCEFPGCRVWFVPNVPWRKYCPEHDRRNGSRRR